MATQDENVQALMELGLTVSQAKVYLTLIAMGKIRSQAIWKHSGVARQDVYRVLAELQDKGLVEKVLATPTEYKAISLKNGLAILLKNKAQEYADAEVKTKNLLQKFQAAPGESTVGESEFTLVPGKEPTRLKFKAMFDNTQKSVDAIFYWKGFVDFINDADVWEKDLREGVKIRFIVYRPKGEKSTPSIVQTLKKKGFIEVRYTSTPPPATLTIFDKGKSLITTSPAPNPLESSSLSLKNSGFIAIVQDYFERMWQSLANLEEA